MKYVYLIGNTPKVFESGLNRIIARQEAERTWGGGGHLFRDAESSVEPDPCFVGKSPEAGIWSGTFSPEFVD